MDTLTVVILGIVAFCGGMLTSYVGYRIYLADQSLKALQSDYQRLLAERERWMQRDV